MSSIHLVFNILRYFFFKPESDNQDRGRTRHRQARPDLWQKKTFRKLVRLDGSQCQCSGRDKTVIIDKRRMGPTCTSAYCQKSKSRHCSTFDEERRKAIFTEFWNMGSCDERYTFAKTIVKKVKKKQARSESEERDSTYDWNISSTEGEHKQVCRKILLALLV